MATTTATLRLDQVGVHPLRAVPGRVHGLTKHGPHGSAEIGLDRNAMNGMVRRQNAIVGLREAGDHRHGKDERSKTIILGILTSERRLRHPRRRRMIRGRGQGGPSRRLRLR